MSNYQRYWDSPESVAEYSRTPFLLRGERLALSSGFGRGVQGKKVLDLACGAGRTTYFLHKMGASVIGVDLAANLIAVARARYPDIEFRVGDMAELDFEDRSFDVVLISFNSLDCLYPKEMRMTALRQVWRVLRPDGTLVLSHHNLAALLCGWYRFMRPAKLAYRLQHILDGSIWKSECYLPDFGVPEVKLYYAHPRQVVTDLQLCGFESSQAIPNDPLLWGLQQVLHTDFFTRLSDPWPYYVCRKTAKAAPPRKCAASREGPQSTKACPRTDGRAVSAIRTPKNSRRSLWCAGLSGLAPAQDSRETATGRIEQPCNLAQVSGLSRKPVSRRGVRLHRFVVLPYYPFELAVGLA